MKPLRCSSQNTDLSMIAGEPALLAGEGSTAKTTTTAGATTMAELHIYLHATELRSIVLQSVLRLSNRIAFYPPPPPFYLLANPLKDPAADTQSSLKKRNRKMRAVVSKVEMFGDLRRLDNPRAGERAQPLAEVYCQAAEIRCSFSALATPILAIKHSFCSIFNIHKITSA